MTKGEEKETEKEKEKALAKEKGKEKGDSQGQPRRSLLGTPFLTPPLPLSPLRCCPRGTTPAGNQAIPSRLWARAPSALLQCSRCTASWVLSLLLAARAVFLRERRGPLTQHHRGCVRHFPPPVGAPSLLRTTTPRVRLEAVRRPQLGLHGHRCESAARLLLVQRPVQRRPLA